MAELKTAVIHSTETGMAGGAEVLETVEFIAQENMRIVAFGGAITMHEGADHVMTVTRTGTFKQSASYVEGQELVSDDGVLMMFKSGASLGESPLRIDYWKPLPDGHYFYLEKGERIYCHFKWHNNSASGHSTAGDVVLYYY